MLDGPSNSGDRSEQGKTLDLGTDSVGVLMLPVFIDLKDRRTVVFGGGPVGFRKASYFARESEVTVVSRDFAPEFQGSGIAQVSADARDAMDEWIERSDLVVAATDDPDVNEAISRKSRARGKYCNRADGASDLLIPSTIMRRNYVVAISTLGRSPGMSKYLRMYLESVLEDRFEIMVDLQEELRAELKDIVPDQRDRERMLWKVLDDRAVWDALGEGIGPAKGIALTRMVREDGQHH